MYTQTNYIKNYVYNPSVRLFIILLFAGDVSINPGPKIFQNMRFVTTNLRSVRHESAALSDLILSKHRPFSFDRYMAIISDTSACHADICPYGFCLYHHPRHSGRGGAVAFLLLEIYII